MKILKSAALVVTLGCLSLSAQAISITWDIVGVGASGGSVTGSFVFDADTTTTSNVSVMTSGGALPTATYSFPHPDFFFAGSLWFLEIAGADLTGGQSLFFVLASSMTNAGGTIGLIGVQTGVCVDVICSSLDGSLPNTLDLSPAGSIVSRVTPVPEPSALSLLVMGLAGIAWVRRRKIA